MPDPNELKATIPVRRNFTVVPNSDFGPGPPLRLTVKDGRVLVWREGKLIGFCANGVAYRIANNG